jgi:hypothetical protein
MPESMLEAFPPAAAAPDADDVGNPWAATSVH